MKITGLQLAHFRCHSQWVGEFVTPLTLIVGKNGQGKTSILEAVRLLSTGKSMRAGQLVELIEFEQELARVKGIVIADNEKADEQTELEVIVTPGLVQGAKSPSRILMVNGVRRLRKNFAGQLLSVIFRPEDMRLMEGSPSRRREYLDDVLELTQREYAHALTQYHHFLERRNKVLQAVREHQAPMNSLHFWNQGLVTHGQVLQEMRKQYLATFVEVQFPLDFSIHYAPSVMSEERITEYQSREIAAGHTLIGPHKDDFTVSMVGRDIATFGSRGQQRMAVLWLKLAEVQYVTRIRGQRPVLLLDDIWSELDETSQQAMTELLSKGQALITTTEPELATRLQFPQPHQVLAI